MGITRVRANKKRRARDVEKTLKAIVYPPVVAGALLFGTVKKKNNRRKKR